MLWAPARSWAAIFLTALLLVVTGNRASAQDPVPDAINYQGRLTDNLGQPVTNGVYQVEFRIWDHPTQSGAGNYYWGRSFPVHVVTNGLFNVVLSNGGGLVTTPAQQTNDLRMAFEGPDRYLGLTITDNPSGRISSPVDLSPRQRLVSAPYAMHAQNATLAATASFALAVYPNVISTGNLLDGAVTSAKILDGTVGLNDLANNSVNGDKLTDGSVAAAKLADQAVTPAKLASSIGLWSVVGPSGPDIYRATGAVVIGKTSASSKDHLDVNGSVRVNEADIYLRGGADTVHGLGYYSLAKPYAGFGVDGPVLYGFSGGALGINQGGNQSITLTWNSHGQVGIGTTNPVAALHVTGEQKRFENSGKEGTGISNEDRDFHTIQHLDNVVAVFDGDVLSTHWFGAMAARFSDARSKEVVGRSSSRRDLETLNQIEITDYRLIDRREDGGRIHKKVIAQQVEQVLPAAISTIAKALPNVYQKACRIDFDSGRQELTLAVDQEHGFHVGDRVDVFTDHGDLIKVEVLKVPSLREFAVASAQRPKTAFVYGKWVNDFRAVDYDAISMLNVSATQELYRQIQTQETELEKLRERNGELERRLATVEVQAREQSLRFAALERLVRESRGVQSASLRHETKP